MMNDLRPDLASIRVPLNKLLLDPNNPRFLEEHNAQVEEQEFADSGVQQTAATRMSQEKFHLEALEQSICANGWQPVDMIFVRRLEPLPGHYVVLEGNRRLMALRNLKNKGALQGDLASAVDPLPVLEIMSAATLEQSRNQVSYLLGVRHHGALKPWSPYAKARNIYARYLQLGKMTGATFRWDPAVADKIAKILSVEVEEIEERLRVYRAMEQLQEVPAIRDVGVKGRFYSLVKEAVAPRERASPLKNYIVQDSQSFRLDDEGLRRMDAVCYFSTAERKNAPINSPDEWRPLAKILQDTDPQRRDAMIQEVEQLGRAPSDVLAARQAELRQPRWELWLEEVAGLLRGLTIGDLDSNDGQAKDVAKRLAAILDGLPDPAARGTTQEVQ